MATALLTRARPWNSRSYAGRRVCKPPTFNPFNLIPHLQAGRSALRPFYFYLSSVLHLLPFVAQGESALARRLLAGSPAAFLLGFFSLGVCFLWHSHSDCALGFESRVPQVPVLYLGLGLLFSDLGVLCVPISACPERSLRRVACVTVPLRVSLRLFFQLSTFNFQPLCHPDRSVALFATRSGGITAPSLRLATTFGFRFSIFEFRFSTLL